MLSSRMPRSGSWNMRAPPMPSKRLPTVEKHVPKNIGVNERAFLILLVMI